MRASTDLQEMSCEDNHRTDDDGGTDKCDDSWQSERQPNCFAPTLSSLDNVGHCAAPLDNALLRL